MQPDVVISMDSKCDNETIDNKMILAGYYSNRGFGQGASILLTTVY